MKLDDFAKTMEDIVFILVDFGETAKLVRGLIDREAARVKLDDAVLRVVRESAEKLDRLEISQGEAGISEAKLLATMEPVLAAIAKNIKTTTRSSEAEMLELIAGVEKRLSEVEKKTTRRAK